MIFTNSYVGLYVQNFGVSQNTVFQAKKHHDKNWLYYGTTKSHKQRYSYQTNKDTYSLFADDSTSEIYQGTKSMLFAFLAEICPFRFCLWFSLTILSNKYLDDITS